MEGKIKILIVEDKISIASEIAKQLIALNYCILNIISDSSELFQQLQTETPDILLININLKGDFYGIELAFLIQKEHKIPIIFLTDNDDEAHFNRAKETNPYAFIHIPINNTELQRTIELVTIRIEKEKKIDEKEEHNFVMSDCIFVRSHDKMVKVCIKDILYIEAERNYCKIHCITKEHLIVSTLKELEEKLKADNLMRIHRSYMVNMHHIDEIGTNHVVIAKKAIPITSDLKKQLMLHIQKV